MPKKLAPLLGYIRGLTGTGLSGELPDRELVQRFADHRDEAAFAALVGRHGAMVLGVCRRVLGNEADAEDAFQATFLVLSRKAGALVEKDAVGPWLFGVAHRLASRARQQARRAPRQGRAGERSSGDPLDELTVREAQAVLDEELARLPERDRGPLVLCYLEGLTQEEAARRLGCPLGTLKGRLVRGRAALQKQLARRGLGLAAVVSTLLLAGKSAAGAPVPLQVATVEAATAFAAGASAGAVAPKAAALAEGVLTSAFSSKLRIAVLVGAIVGGLGMGVAAREAQGPGPSAVGPAARVAVVDWGEVGAVAAPPREKALPGGVGWGGVGGRSVGRSPATWRHHADLAVHSKAVRAVAFSPDGGRIASGGDDGWVRVWEVGQAKELLALPGQGARPIRAVAFSRGGDYLAAGNDDGTVLGWGLRGTGRPSPDVVFERAGREAHAVWVGADRGTVARAWCDGCVEWQGGPTGGPRLLPGQEGKVHGVALCRQGRTVAWAMQDGSVMLWGLARREQRGHFPLHASQVCCVAFSPEGDTAASADRAGTLKAWETATGREQATASGHEGQVRALALASGGKLLASGGDDRTVRVWDARTGKELAVLAGHRGPVHSVAFSPDGRFLASASSDGTVKLWTCAPASLRGR